MTVGVVVEIVELSIVELLVVVVSVVVNLMIVVPLCVGLVSSRLLLSRKQWILKSQFQPPKCTRKTEENDSTDRSRALGLSYLANFWIVMCVKNAREQTRKSTAVEEEGEGA